jgi:hypothetical protein
LREQHHIQVSRPSTSDDRQSVESSEEKDGKPDLDEVGDGYDSNKNAPRNKKSRGISGLRKAVKRVEDACLQLKCVMDAIDTESQVAEDEALKCKAAGKRKKSSRTAPI